MAFNITDPKQIIAAIPKEFQESFAKLLKSKKFRPDSFFGGTGPNKATRTSYTVKVYLTVLNKKSQHILDDKFKITFKPSRLGPTNKPVSKKKSGLDTTSIQEQMQCFYTALRFKSTADLNEKNCDFEEDVTVNVAKRCFFTGIIGETPDSAMALYNTTENHSELKNWLGFDNQGENVFMKTANAIHKFVKGKFRGIVYFHRGSKFMEAIYDSFQKAQAIQKDPKNGKTVWSTRSINSNKWNPGDMWISTMNPNPDSSKPFCYGDPNSGDCKTYDMLRDSVIKHAKKGEILAISLKKTGGGSATVTEYNLKERKHNNKTIVKNFNFGKTGDFFASKDLYLNFSNGSEMQFKPGGIDREWRGEITGGTARGGNISGQITNYFCEKFLKRSIGGKSLGRWHENQFYSTDWTKMHNLYQKYLVKQNSALGRFKPVSLPTFKKGVIVAEKKEKGGKGFTFSKYMGLLFLETLYGPGGGDLGMCTTKIMRYCQSNLDISSYYIKVA